LAGIVWTQLALLKAIDGEEDDQRHETDVARALGSYEADALSTRGWSDAEGAPWTLGVNKATGGWAATTTVAEAAAEDDEVVVDWAVTLATKTYDPGGSSAAGTVTETLLLPMRMFWTAKGSCDPADQLMDTGEASTKD